MTIEDRSTPADPLEELVPGASQAATLGHRSADERHRPDTTPDLIGLGGPDAHAVARSAGVHLYVSVWETRVGPWGMVVDQWPTPGTRVRRGARIQVVVSGRPYSPVPDVRGLPLQAALERLTWVGLVPIANARRASDTVPVEHVDSTRPAAGTLAKPGSVVALDVTRPATTRQAGAHARR